MTNIYVLGNTTDDNILNTIIPNMLAGEHGLTDKSKIITGDMLDDADLIADRLTKDTTAWLVIITEDEIITLHPDAKEEAIKLLLAHPNEKASDVILAANA